MSFSGANQLLTGLPASALLADFSSIVVFTEADTQWWAEVDTADPTKSRWANAAKDTEYAFDCIYFSNGPTQKTAIYRVRHLNISSTVAPQLRSYPPKASRASYAPGDTYGQYAAYGSVYGTYWHNLNDLEDRTGNTSNLTLTGTGVTEIDGPVGKAVRISDLTTFFSTTQDQITSGIENHTLMIFMRQNGSVVSMSELFALNNSANLSSSLRASNGTATFNSRRYSNASASASYTQDAWNQIAGRENGGSSRDLLVNGVVEDTDTTSVSYYSLGSDNVKLGDISYISGSETIDIGPSALLIGDVSDSWVKFESSQVSNNSSFWTRTEWDDGGTGTTTNALTGMLSAAPGLSGPLGVSARLAGLLDTLETLDADLSVLASLGGNLGESPEISGGLDVAARLSGNLEAAPGVAGTLHVSIPLSGACESLPGLVGSLSVTIEGENLLSGNLSAASQLSGQLSVRAPLTGILATDPDFTGELTSELRNQLEGALQAAAEALGTLSVKVPLSGAMEADPELSGELTGGKILVMEGAIASAPVQFGIIGTAPVSFGAIANAKIKGRWE